MARVVLITTGSMEELAFPRSLARLFPEHEFVALRMLSFTSAPLPPNYAELREKRAWLNIEKFATKMVGQIAGGRRDEPRADFVIGIEDMELCNAATPEHITGALRDAVDHSLANWGDAPTRKRLGEAIRNQCSFHLMTPMTEAYFFADPAALARATAPAPDRPCRFDPSTCDVEEFHVDDPVYVGVPVVPKRQRVRNDWRCEDRHGHPKHYVAYLTDAQLDGKARYSETKQGCDALADLDWPAIVRSDRSPAVARFARSFLADLVDMLGSSPSCPTVIP
jgi:hypothetical protein